MKANELMVGDLIKTNSHSWRDETLKNKYCKIEMVGRNYLRCSLIDNPERQPYGEENSFDPIPLTPDILEKNGWIKTKYAYGRDCMEIHGTNKLPEGIENALSMARWSIDKNFQYHFLDLYMWKGSVMQHNVHYVHQLQHAFKIFGIEKEIVL